MSLVWSPFSTYRERIFCVWDGQMQGPATRASSKCRRLAAQVPSSGLSGSFVLVGAGWVCFVAGIVDSRISLLPVGQQQFKRRDRIRRNDAHNVGNQGHLHQRYVQLTGPRQPYRDPSLTPPKELHTTSHPRQPSSAHAPIHGWSRRSRMGRRCTWHQWLF